MIQGFSPFLYVPAKSKCKTTFAPGNLQVFSLPQSKKFPEQFLSQKPHRENAPTVLGGCITKRLPGFRFAVGGYRFANSPFVLFWVQMTEGMGYGPPIIPGRIYESPLNSAHNELSDLEGKAHISETKVLFSGML